MSVLISASMLGAASIVGGSSQRHVIGQTSMRSGTELSSDGYVVATFQQSVQGFTLQTSLFAGIASDRARFAELTYEHRSSFGTQIDATDALSSPAVQAN